MSRSQPYRTKIPVHVIQLLDVASRITLFLVGQRGPLSFTFKDRLDNQYKTSIGPQLKCTCAPDRNDHCIHTIYILLKVFKVSVDNPIIWQAAYADSELSDLLAGKHTVNQARRYRLNFQNMFEDSPNQLPSEFIKKHQLKKETKTLVLVNPLKLNEDSVCPICQQNMNQSMCLSYCKVKCGNNYHLQCLKVWATHKMQQGSSINCPMCRSKLPETFLAQLQRQQEQFTKKQSEKMQIDFSCASCGVKIPNNPHKCLLCTTYQLCQPCYSSKKHIKHPFIVRGEDGRWRGAAQRRQQQLKLVNYLETKRKQTYNQQIIKKLRKVGEDPNKLIDFIASAYPYVSKYISDKIDPYKKLDFNPSDVRCFKCGSTRMIFLRRLSCGHFIDHQCLKQCIVKQKFYCDQDGTQFLKGYQNLMQKQKVLARKRNQYVINNVSPEFKVEHIEEDQSYNFVREGQEIQAPTLNQILSGRQQHSHHHHRQEEHIRNRLTSNIIRSVRNTSNTSQRTNSRQIALRPPLPPAQPQRNSIPRAPQIRIRNINGPGRAQDRTLNRIRQRSQIKNKRQEMGFMIEALIGRKLK